MLLLLLTFEFGNESIYYNIIKGQQHSIVFDNVCLIYTIHEHMQYDIFINSKYNVIKVLKQYIISYYLNKNNCRILFIIYSYSHILYVLIYFFNI